MGIAIRPSRGVMTRSFGRVRPQVKAWHVALNIRSTYVYGMYWTSTRPASGALANRVSPPASPSGMGTGRVGLTTGRPAAVGRPPSRALVLKREILISGSARETRVAILED